MLLKEVIMTALTYLGDDEIAIDANIVKHPKLDTLLRCANIVIKEIATDYLPLTATEQAEVKDGRISYDALSRRVLEVLTVKDADTDVRSAFRHTPSALELVNRDMKRANVKYNYLPTDVNLDEECPLSPLVSAKTAAMGVCSEFCLIEGMYEQSIVFSERYKEDLRCAVRKKGEIKIKPRRWY
ncbi:MAG: hypothetical protein K2O95_07880 [Clostridia bacterium]|nr:hypothetical protein [Clostridia bacterium]MDE7080016.1 hypothetical protein [Clostridia bacterium]